MKNTRHAVRKLGEAIVIGDVRITVDKIFRDSVRIGVDAPSDQMIKLTELQEFLPQPQPAEAAFLNQESQHEHRRSAR